MESLLTENNTHIAGFNEMFLKANYRKIFWNYILNRIDREIASGGGVALLDQKSITHKLLQITNTRLIENLSVEVIINKRRVRITTAYYCKYSQCFSKDPLLLISPRFLRISQLVLTNLAQ